jgi:hypothetical protein
MPDNTYDSTMARIASVKPPTILPDERQAIAKARTSTPSGGYRLGPSMKPQKASQAEQASQAGSTMAERQREEAKLGLSRRSPLFPRRNHQTGDLE